MAASSVIGALRVNLGLDSAQFTRGTQQAQTSMQKMQRYMKFAGAAIAGALAGAAAGMVKLGFDSIKTADEISKAAQSIGIGTEELSRLRYAADISGVSFESLQSNLGRFNRGIFDAANGTGNAGKAFARLGIEVRNAEGGIKTQTQLLGELAAKFQSMPDGVEKSALAMQIFGKSGAEMIPFLNQGADGIAKLTDEADKFGVVIDQETGRKAEEFNDNLTRLQGVFSSLATQIMADNLPALVSFTNALVDNQGAVRGFANEISKSIQGLTFLVGKIIDAGRAVSDYFTPKIQMAGAVLRGLGFLGPKSNSTQDVFEALRKNARASVPAIGGATGALKEFQSVATGGGAGGRSRGAAGRTVVAQVRDEAQEAERALSSLRSALTSVQNQLDPALAAFRRTGEQQGVITDARKAGIVTQAEASRLIGLTLQVSEGFVMIDEKLPGMAKAANDNTRQIADSFAQMSERVVNSLQNLSNSIQRGDFLGILGGVLNTVMQLGSVGAFGKKFQTSVNSAPSIPGFANGTNFAPGGMALVGERGPELVNLPRGSQVIPNHKLGGSQVQVVPSPYFDVVVDGRVMSAAPMIAAGGASIAAAQSSTRARRSVRR
jgi:hypothetical protein